MHPKTKNEKKFEQWLLQQYGMTKKEQRGYTLEGNLDSLWEIFSAADMVLFARGLPSIGKDLAQLGKKAVDDVAEEAVEKTVKKEAAEEMADTAEDLSQKTVDKDNALEDSSALKRKSETSPSGEIGGSPKGNYANETSRGLMRQNESADLLAKQGYDVTILDEVQGGNGYGVKSTSNPDLLVEGRVFDVYSPGATTGNKNIINTIATKTKTQAERIILNLDDYAQDLDVLKSDILRKISGDLKYLEELKVIKEGTIETWFVR